MKTIGIIGGIGPPSTVKYYEGLNDGIAKLVGNGNTARIIITSLNGKDVDNFRSVSDEVEGKFYAAEAKKLETAGADFILIASNTSHKNVPWIEKEVSIPVLHLADATAQTVKAAGISHVALLGTAPTMERDFYKSRLIASGLQVTVPDADDRKFVSSTIYGELIRGVVADGVNEKFTKIIHKLKEQGVGGVILGCTELTLLDLPDAGLPLFDTTKIHIDVALKYALS